MKIVYQQNPLANKIILNDTEKRLFFWRYLIDTMFTDPLFDILCMIEEIKYKNNLSIDRLDKIYKNVKNIENTVDESEYDEKKIEAFIDAIQSSHFGDCIKQCNTCLKCYVEEKLNIASMPNYPWKDHIGSSLFQAFNQKSSEGYKNITIDEAIYFLSNRKYAEADFEQKDIERWKIEDNKAREYLIYYKKEVGLASTALTEKEIEIQKTEIDIWKKYGCPPAFSETIKRLDSMSKDPGETATFIEFEINDKAEETEKN